MSVTESLTRRLLSVVGSPFECDTEPKVGQDLASLYRYAAENRMALLCLDGLSRRGIRVFRDERERLERNHSRAMDLAIRLSDLFEDAGVDYAFFKTLRPYREATVDVDILSLRSSCDALKAMDEAGYPCLECGPLSTTFKDPVSNLNVDVYDEIGVSRLVYLDKEKLSKHVVRRDVADGSLVRTLSPAADLLAVIAHSVFKEHMYVLSEYYSTLLYLHEDPSGSITSSLRRLAETCKAELALEIHLGITASLHKDVHGFVPSCISDAWDGLEICGWELWKARKPGAAFPLKYHPMTIAKALAGLLKESKGRHSIALQALKMFNPHFSMRATRQLFEHMRRKTY